MAGQIDLRPGSTDIFSFGNAKITDAFSPPVHRETSMTALKFEYAIQSESIYW